MRHPRPGDTVAVHYTGRLADGTVFDSSREREPMELTVGGGQVIPTFEEAVAGMQPGDARTITIPADQAYGPHRQELMVAVGRSEFPDHIEPAVGLALEVRQEGGEPAIVRVAEVSGEEITLDANHPLAGEDLTFDLELVAIKPRG